MTWNTCLTFSIGVSILVLICVFVSLFRIFQKQMFYTRVLKANEAKLETFRKAHQMSRSMPKRKSSKITPMTSIETVSGQPTIAPIRPPSVSSDRRTPMSTPPSSDRPDSMTLSSFEQRRRPSVVLAAELMDPGPPPTDVLSDMEDEERKRRQIMKYV